MLHGSLANPMGPNGNVDSPSSHIHSCFLTPTDERHDQYPPNPLCAKNTCNVPRRTKWIIILLAHTKPRELISYFNGDLSCSPQATIKSAVFQPPILLQGQFNDRIILKPALASKPPHRGNGNFPRRLQELQKHHSYGSLLTNPSLGLSCFTALGQCPMMTRKPINGTIRHSDLLANNRLRSGRPTTTLSQFSPLVETQQVRGQAAVRQSSVYNFTA